jgi:hypothetical protein
MSADSRIHFLEQLAFGEQAPRELVGLSVADCTELSRRAEAALARGEARDAALLLEVLNVLEPRVPEYALRRALALHAIGEDVQALKIVTQYIDSELPRPKERLVEALRLRAGLSPKHAEGDLYAAQLLERPGSRRAGR